MSYSKLIWMPPTSVKAAVEVLNEVDSERFDCDCRMEVEIEPCGNHQSWVTTQSECDMEAIEGSIADGIECGALPI